MQYLYEKQHYVDLYDLLTIRECLDWEENITKRKLPRYQNKEIPKKQEPSLKKFLIEFPLYFIKGERYEKKSERIREWINSDKQKQNKYDNAKEPSNISCLFCGGEMIATFKELYDITDTNLRVLFFFDCLNCKKRRGVFDTGEVFKAREELCPKCEAPIKTKVSKQKGKAIWITICTHCNYLKTEVDDFDVWKKKRDKEKKDDEKLLLKYREKYCLSDKEGQEFIQSKASRNRISEILAEHKRKEADPVYTQVKQLNKLSVVELEKVLTKTLEKEKYVKLAFSSPEIGQFVIVPFTIQDADSSRSEYDSTHKLKKTIKALLNETNWRLMSEGTTYRLGYVSGRLKGYEREEDLASLIRANK